MSELRPGFIRLPRIDGERPALVRVDHITAILENEVRSKGPGTPAVRHRLIQVGPHLSIKTPLEEGEIISRMKSAGGTSVITVVPENPE